MLINKNQITRIYYTYSKKCEEVNDFFSGIGNWQYKSAHIKKKLFGLIKIHQEEGWYRQKEYGHKSLYFKTDDELLEYLKKSYTSKWFIKNKTLYRGPKISIYMSDQNYERVFFKTDDEAKDFMKELTENLDIMIIED